MDQTSSTGPRKGSNSKKRGSGASPRGNSWELPVSREFYARTITTLINSFSQTLKSTLTGTAIDRFHLYLRGEYCLETEEVEEVKIVFTLLCPKIDVAMARSAKARHRAALRRLAKISMKEPELPAGAAGEPEAPSEKPASAPEAEAETPAAPPAPAPVAAPVAEAAEVKGEDHAAGECVPAAGGTAAQCAQNGEPRRRIPHPYGLDYEVPRGHANISPYSFPPEWR